VRWVCEMCVYEMGVCVRDVNEMCVYEMGASI